MKYMRNIFMILCIISLASPAYAEVLSVDTIEVQDSSTIEVTLSENPNLGSGSIDAGLNILNDLDIQEILIDEASEDELTMILSQDILPQMKYSLVTISGMKGSIDFTSPDDIIGYIAMNSNLGDGQDIESVEVIDARTLKVRYNEELESENKDEFEYKFLLESKITSIEKRDFMQGILTISVSPNLQENQQYILMFLDVQDVSGNYLEFDTGIYDFETKDFSDTDMIKKQDSQENTETITEEVLEEVIEEETVISDVVITPLNAAPSLQKDSGGVKIIEDVKRIENIEPVVEQEIQKVIAEEKQVQDIQEVTDIESIQRVTKSIQEVAQTATKTPATGAATWVLIVMSLVINTFYYCTRKKSYKLI